MEDMSNAGSEMKGRTHSELSDVASFFLNGYSSIFSHAPRGGLTSSGPEAAVENDLHRPQDSICFKLVLQTFDWPSNVFQK